MPRKKSTTSSAQDPTEAPQVVASKKETRVVASEPSSQPVQGRSKNMANSEELGTIIEYSEDIATAEAPPPLPKREYRAQIKAAKQKMSQRDTRYAEVLFYIAPEDYPADFTEGDPDGTTIAYRRLSLEDKPAARFQTRQFCTAIGAPMAKRIDVSEWVGLEASVLVDHETFEGITRSVITKVQPL